MSEEPARHKFLLGWLRLILGFAQMSLAAMSLGSLLIIGLHRLTLWLCIAATLLACVSRLLYRGNSGFSLKQMMK